jgi:hypothetical protein
MFDRNIEMWTANDGEAQKAASKTKKNTYDMLDTNLVYYNESFGAVNSDLVVMCPDTDYWQDKMVSVMEEMANTYKVDAIYID